MSARGVARLMEKTFHTVQIACQLFFQGRLEVGNGYDQVHISARIVSYACLLLSFKYKFYIRASKIHFWDTMPLICYIEQIFFLACHCYLLFNRWIEDQWLSPTY